MREDEGEREREKGAVGSGSEERDGAVWREGESGETGERRGERERE